jgi:hypothetical protein
MPFQGPINSELSALSRAEARAREVRCTCQRSPFCRGRDSADWLSCDRACKACKPAPWQPPIQPGQGGMDADQG